MRGLGAFLATHSAERWGEWPPPVQPRSTSAHVSSLPPPPCGAIAAVNIHHVNRSSLTQVGAQQNKGHSWGQTSVGVVGVGVDGVGGGGVVRVGVGVGVGVVVWLWWWYGCCCVLLLCVAVVRLLLLNG